MLEVAIILAWAIGPWSLSKEANIDAHNLPKNKQVAALKSSPPEHEPHVEEILQSLHDFHQQRKALFVEFERTIFDPVWGDCETSKGSARVQTPNLARLDIAGRWTESLIVPGNGQFWIYEGARGEGQKSTVSIFQLDWADHFSWTLPGGLGWLTTAPLDWAKDFKIEIVRESKTEVSLRLTPLAGCVDVERVELTWNRTNRLLTKIEIEEPTRRISRYHITKAVESIEINEEDFTKFVVPEGWEVRQAGNWPFRLLGQ